MKLQYFCLMFSLCYLSPLQGVAGGVDRREKINSTDDVFVAKIAFLYSLLNKHASNQTTLTNIHMILVE